MDLGVAPESGLEIGYLVPGLTEKGMLRHFFPTLRPPGPQPQPQPLSEVPRPYGDKLPTINGYLAHPLHTGTKPVGNPVELCFYPEDIPPFQGCRYGCNF